MGRRAAEVCPGNNLSPIGRFMQDPLQRQASVACIGDGVAAKLDGMPTAVRMGMFDQTIRVRAMTGLLDPLADRLIRREIQIGRFLSRSSDSVSWVEVERPPTC